MKLIVLDTAAALRDARAWAHAHTHFTAGPCDGCDARTAEVMRLNRIEVLWEVQRTTALLSWQ